MEADISNYGSGTAKQSQTKKPRSSAAGYKCFQYHLTCTLETLGYEESHNTTKTTFELLMDNLDTSSDMAKVIAGCHENFLGMHLNDPMMSKVRIMQKVLIRNRLPVA